MGAGGMPSSHSAVVAGLATLIGKYEGVDSPIFAVAFIMAFVVNSSIAQILLGCAILICATVLNLWLEVKYKNFLVKKDFILSIAVFLGALILTK